MYGCGAKLPLAPGSTHRDGGDQHQTGPLPVPELQRRDPRQHHYRDGHHQRNQQPPQRVRLGRASFLARRGLAGSAAVYPACSTTEIRSPVLTAAEKLTWAVSVAKLTVAVMPSSLLSFFSILAAHEAHVIPPIASSTRRGAPPGLSAEFSAVNALTRITSFPCARACTRIVRKEKIFGPNGMRYQPQPTSAGSPG